MNHLQEAKKMQDIVHHDGYERTAETQYGILNALIAIAEQLEKIIKGYELPRVVMSIEEDK